MWVDEVHPSVRGIMTSRSFVIAPRPLNNAKLSRSHVNGVFAVSRRVWRLHAVRFMYTLRKSKKLAVFPDAAESGLEEKIEVMAESEQKAAGRDGRTRRGKLAPQSASATPRPRPSMDLSSHYFPTNQHDLSSPCNSIASPKNIAESVSSHKEKTKHPGACIFVRSSNLLLIACCSLQTCLVLFSSVVASI